jgi:hypothetical protein
MARGINDETTRRTGDGDDKHEIEDCTAVGSTEKALRAIVHGTAMWIPLSQIHDDSEVFEKNHTGTLAVKGWFARKNGWA